MSPLFTSFVSSCRPTNIAVIRKSDECNNRQYQSSLFNCLFLPVPSIAAISRRNVRANNYFDLSMLGYSAVSAKMVWMAVVVLLCFRYGNAKYYTWHAQGIHNVAAEKDHSAYLSEEYFDAHLTSLGWKPRVSSLEGMLLESHLEGLGYEQVDNLRRHVISSGLAKKIDLVITSPLLRTMQTAVGVFGGDGFVDEAKGLPLMIENAGNCGRPAISSVETLPFIAVEACREHLIESNEDNLWKPDVREANEDLADRGIQFINWLWTRKEKEIAIVTHSGFLLHTLKKFSKDFHPLIKDEISKHFANCELRSLVLVDNRFIS
ncbi:hypothetical protein HPP92_027693 [Vanilla planifolia]|uniref:Phosphoglycerate mutase-like protein 1 n=1 Tax=Vanilla planifolia TaxID=51239 RepID=A0A835PAV4_VANPL|nr:hypothetical protein HPP92_027693 [Vanilla planifolia]